MRQGGEAAKQAARDWDLVPKDAVGNINIWSLDIETLISFCLLFVCLFMNHI